MSSVNKVVLVGRLTKPIELRKTETNMSVCRITVACNRKIKNKDTGQYDADFVNCVVWNQSADFLHQYAGQGDIVSVEGRITTRDYTNDAGQRVFITEVTAESVGIVQKYEQKTQTYVGETTPQVSASQSVSFEEDDLPFY